MWAYKPPRCWAKCPSSSEFRWRISRTYYCRNFCPFLVQKLLGPFLVQNLWPNCGPSLVHFMFRFVGPVKLLYTELFIQQWSYLHWSDTTRFGCKFYTFFIQARLVLFYHIFYEFREIYCLNGRFWSNTEILKTFNFLNNFMF